MEIELSIGRLAQYIEEFNGNKLIDNEAQSTSALGLKVLTPTGKAAVNWFIKKEKLSMLSFVLDNGYEFRCATTHILRSSGKDIFARDCNIGTPLEHFSGTTKVLSLKNSIEEDCYDVSIDTPHLFYDANGLIHHNTICTAMLSLSVEPYGRSIVIVPNVNLVTQTEADYINLGLDVGVYYGGRKETAKKHTICTWQSLNILLKNTKDGVGDITIEDFLQDVICVISDECHQVKADVLKSLLTGVMSRIPIRWGLTGTIPKEKMDEMSLMISIGPVTNYLSAASLQDQGILAKCHVNIVQLQDNVDYRDYQTELKFLLSDDKRLTKIAKIIHDANASGNTLVLIDRIEAGNLLTEKINEITPDIAVFVSGGTKTAVRTEHYDEIATSSNKIILATYGVAAVGINIPRLFNVILMEPGKSFVRTIQSIGRGLRKAPDKDYVLITDITSNCRFSKRHLTSRKAFYKEAAYPFSIEKINYKP